MRARLSLCRRQPDSLLAVDLTISLAHQPTPLSLYSVHYKRRASASPKRAFACLHGFGANETSWAVGNAAQMLAQRLDAIVVAHDAPGFGLTHRSKRLADYSTERNGAIGVALLERSAASLGAAGGGESRGQRILIGHSLGGLAAACAAVEDPRPSALVLVAPAIIVAGALQAAAKSEAEAPQSRRRSPLTLPARLVRALAVATLSCLGDVVTILVRAQAQASPALRIRLRSAPRSFVVLCCDISRRSHLYSLSNRLSPLRLSCRRS